MRLSTRRIMIVVALVALNLAAALAAARQYPRKHFSGLSVGDGRGEWINGTDGSSVYVPGKLESYFKRPLESRPRILIRGPVRLPTLAEIWAPVLASVAVTILAIVLAPRPGLWRRARERMSRLPLARLIGVRAESGRGGAPVRPSARRAMIVVALVALNLAAALATASQYPRTYFSGVSVGDGVGAWINGTDGRIVFVPGRLGDLDKRPFASRPHILIRGPARLPTLAEIWAPVLASAAVTILVIGIAPRPGL